MSMKVSYTIDGSYGSHHTPCEVFVVEDENDGLLWYAIEGSQNANAIPLDEKDVLVNGVWVEEIQDLGCFTAPSPINTDDHLLLLVLSEQD